MAVRVSINFEDGQDLINDFARALGTRIWSVLTVAAPNLRSMLKTWLESELRSFVLPEFAGGVEANLERRLRSSCN